MARISTVAKASIFHFPVDSRRQLNTSIGNGGCAPSYSRAINQATDRPALLPDYAEVVSALYVRRSYGHDLTPPATPTVLRRT